MHGHQILRLLRGRSHVELDLAVLPCYIGINSSELTVGFGRCLGAIRRIRLVINCCLFVFLSRHLVT